MCGINGMGTWVVSTICCAAEVESQRSHRFPMAKQGSVAWVWSCSFCPLDSRHSRLFWAGGGGGGACRLAFSVWRLSIFRVGFRDQGKTSSLDVSVPCKLQLVSFNISTSREPLIPLTLTPCHQQPFKTYWYVCYCALDICCYIHRRSSHTYLRQGSHHTPRVSPIANAGFRHHSWPLESPETLYLDINLSSAPRDFITR